tara:strand:+ start:105 stop:719 length:615 start_codon:yes stop_codon:yes gene_type:complete
MKIHRVVQMLGATTSTGKLADDMYDLNYKDYYSKEEGKYIPISHMDFQHMVRAFAKLCAEDQDVTLAKHDGKAEQMKELQQKYDHLREVYAIMFDNCDVKDKHIDEWKEKHQKEVDNAEFWKNAYYESVGIKGKVYVFSDIPNDCDGQRFTDDLKKYLNKESYKMRIRGQYLKDEIKETEGWKKYERGQPISHSKCLRVYIDAN